MRKHLIQFLLVAVLSVFSAAAFAQTTVRGQLVDSETGEPLVGAAVMVEGTTQGSVTDIDGYFKQSVASNATLLFKYVGYKDQKKKITQKGASVDLGAIPMEPDAVMLKDVVITSSVAVARKTPVAVSTITPVFIEEKLGTQEFPEVLKSTPGVYVTKDGGGYGDAQTRVRGFDSENVAMMINGVPMNGILVQLGRSGRCDKLHAGTAWSGGFQSFFSGSGRFYQRYYQEYRCQERRFHLLRYG